MTLTSITIPQTDKTYFGCLCNKSFKGERIISFKIVCFFLLLRSILFALLYIESAEIIAGTKNIERSKAKNTPKAVNRPKSRIIPRYAPNINDTKPIIVVNAARITGTVIYANALINALLRSWSKVALIRFIT